MFCHGIESFLHTNICLYSNYAMMFCAYFENILLISWGLASTSLPPPTKHLDQPSKHLDHLDHLERHLDPLGANLEHPINQLSNNFSGGTRIY